MSIKALIDATESLKKREGDILPTLKTVFFEQLKNKYPRKRVQDVLIGHKGGSWGSDFFENGIKAKVLRSPDMRFGFIDYENAEERYFTQKEIENFNLLNNDILVIKSNGSLDLVGKSQIYKINPEYPNVVASNFLMVLSPRKDLIYPEYLDLFLKSPEALVWRFDTQKTTTGLRNLSSTAFLNIEIPVPNDIAEQVFLFEKFSRIIEGDIGESELELKRFYSLTTNKKKLDLELTHQLTLVKQLRQAFLREAMQGKLVPQNPADGHAKDLLAQIKAEKAKLGKKERPLPPIKPEEIPFEIPEGWVWCRLGEVCEFITSGSRNWNQFYSSEGDLFIRSQNIRPDCLDLTNKAYVKLPPKTEGIRTEVLKNDILITITGAGVSNCGLVRDADWAKAYVSQHVALIRTIRQEMAKWIHTCIISESVGKLQFSALIYGDKPGLNLQQLNQLIIPIPSFNEQVRVSKKLDELIFISSILENSIQQGELETEQLLNQVLREALT